MSPAPARERASRALLLLAVGAILLATLHPDESYTGTTRLVPQWRFDVQLGDALRNVLLFAPLGAALAARPTGLGRALLAAVALSLGVELAQLGIPGRAGSPIDVGTNALGALLGFAWLRRAATWRRPSPATRRALVLGSGLAVVGSVGLAAALFAPDWERSAHAALFTPEFDYREHYGGEVVAARLAGHALPVDSEVALESIRPDLAGDFELRLDLVAGTPSARPAPVFLINDERGRHVLEVAVDGGDLLHQYRTRGRTLGLEPARVRLFGALRAVSPGEPLPLAVARRGDDLCLEAAGRRSCGHGFTAGDAWLLLAPSLRLWGPLRGSLGVAWIALLFVPLGYWGRWDAASAGGWAAAVLALLAAPWLGALVATPVGQLCGAAAGGLLGAAGSRVARARDELPAGSPGIRR